MEKFKYLLVRNLNVALEVHLKNLNMSYKA